MRSVFDELFGGLLAPDEVVFAVMLRGYGAASARPQWNEISSCLNDMERTHGIMPSTGGVEESGLRRAGHTAWCQVVASSSMYYVSAGLPGGVSQPACMPP